MKIVDSQVQVTTREIQSYLLYFSYTDRKYLPLILLNV